jgi:hypothetical protein
MVQELQQHSVPEELYNLTQLAEVTLIAGKLSTTDVDQIKNYISKSDGPMDSTTTSSGIEEVPGRYSYYNLQPAHIQHANKLIPISYEPSTDNDYDKFSYESTKKKWKNDWENHRKYQEVDNESPPRNYLEQPLNFFMGDVTKSPISQHKPSSVSSVSSPNSSSTLSYLVLSSPSSSISSDDDSSKSVSSYSHKIFDRKKKRTFPQSSTESDNNSLTGDLDRDTTKYSTNLTNDIICDNLNLTESNKQNSDNNINKFNESSVSSVLNDCYERGTIWNPPQDGCKGGSDDGMHVCPECGKKYSTSSNLARHRQTHR